MKVTKHAVFPISIEEERKETAIHQVGPDVPSISDDDTQGVVSDEARTESATIEDVNTDSTEVSAEPLVEQRYNLRTRKPVDYSTSYSLGSVEPVECYVSGGRGGWGWGVEGRRGVVAGTCGARSSTPRPPAHRPAPAPTPTTNRQGQGPRRTDL
ncbi:hypothetical protein K1T71_010548 [Dendrolimus kikuchii]|uniref:Uncharacterized protein n=1 Tax=Dendrolimus kikuchii TaxID=765133 RepID=A0ACC1CP66_9NEOP|nr:hypothetical protein K1T71_010548 [Dendrolimus kikuchii]